MVYCIYIFGQNLINVMEETDTGYANTVLNRCCVQYQIYGTLKVMFLLRLHNFHIA